MAEAGSNNETLMEEGKQDDKLERVLSQLGDLTRTVRENHDTVTRMISDKTQEVRDDLNLQMGQMTNRIQRIEDQVQELKTGKEFDPEKCVMMYHIPRSEGETEASLQQKVEEIMARGIMLPGIEVVRVKRCFGDPGPVKVEYYTENNKVDVLKSKGNLKNRREYSNIYVRSAKSHEERLMELNLKTLMEHLQIGNEFRFTGSGKLVYKDPEQERARREARSDRGRGRYMRGGFNRGGGRGGRGGFDSIFNPEDQQNDGPG